MKTFMITAGVLSLLSFSSCKKDAELVKATPVMNISIISFSANAAAAFTIVVNDALVEDSLTNGQPVSKLIARADGSQHLIVKDHFSGATLIDTAIAVSGKTAALTLLQLNADSDPILVGQTDENIPENHRQQAFFCTNDILPDAIGLQIYGAHYDPNTFELLKIDTLATYKKINKGKLSEFILIADNPDPSVVYYFYQLLDVRTLQRLPNQVVPFDPANYSGVLFPFDPGTSGTEKHYINNISASGSPDFFDLYCDRLISY